MSLIHATINQKLTKKAQAKVLVRLCNADFVSAQRTKLSQQYAHALAADYRKGMQRTPK